VVIYYNSTSPCSISGTPRVAIVKYSVVSCELGWVVLRLRQAQHISGNYVRACQVQFGVSIYMGLVLFTLP
jgi:hypothetical protein